MKRWFFFFFLVAVITTVASMGGFSGAAAEGEAAGAVGIGKALFLSLIAITGLGYTAWLLYARRKARARRSVPPPPHQLRDTEDLTRSS